MLGKFISYCNYVWKEKARSIKVTEQTSESSNTSMIHVVSCLQFLASYNVCRLVRLDRFLWLYYLYMPCSTYQGVGTLGTQYRDSVPIHTYIFLDI